MYKKKKWNKSSLNVRKKWKKKKKKTPQEWRINYRVSKAKYFQIEKDRKTKNNKNDIEN